MKNKLKLFNKFNVLVLACTALLLACLAPPAMAQGFVQQSFLAPGVSAVNVFGTGYSGNAPALSWTGTNVNGYVSGQGTNAIFGTNSYVRYGVLVTNTGAFKTVPLWANRDGTMPSFSIAWHLEGTNIMFTNRFQLRFVAVPFKSPPTNYPNRALAANNIYTVNIDLTNNATVYSAAGVNPVNVGSTNITSTIFPGIQGAYGIALLDIQPTFGGTNGLLRELALVGWAPTP